MEPFKIIQKEFVPEFNLELYGNMLNKRETLHNEAIKASSELKQAIANLNLNEAEEGFRQQLVADVEKTINDNSTLGDYAASYDDMIKLSGDIISNPGLIGRLKAQQDYQNFINKIEDSNMPDDYKEYYKIKNKYYYQDKINQNGQIIGGSKWEPTTSPTNIIPLSEMVDKAIKRAAADSGQSSITQWLDENGNPTTNPNKVFDGAVYNTVTRSWEKLGADKIRQAIDAVIEETPGAKESLDQDYNVAEWIHDNKVAENNNRLVISDITDENGVKLTPQEYLNKRLNGAAQSSSYHKIITKTDYGNGLQTYKAAQKAIETQKQLSSLQGRQNDEGISGRGSVMRVEVNKGGKAYSENKEIIGLFKEYVNTINLDLPVEGNIDSLQAIVNTISNPKDKVLFSKYLSIYKENEENLNNYIKNLSPEEKANYDFALRMDNGGELIAGASKFDDRVLNAIDRLYGGNDEISISFKNEEFLNNVVKSLIGNKGKVEDLGLKLQGNELFIPKDSYNVLPLLSNILQNNLKSFGGKDKQYYNLNDYSPNRRTGDSPITFDGGSLDFAILNNTYSLAQETKRNYSEKYDIDADYILVPTVLYGGNSFADTYLYEMYSNGLIDKQTRDEKTQYYNESVKNIALNANYDQYGMFISENGKIGEAVKDSKDRYEYGEIIKSALKAGNAEIIPANVLGYSDPTNGGQGGYWINIFDPKIKGIQNTKQISFYIPALAQETAADIMFNNPMAASRNQMHILGETKSVHYLSSAINNSYLGEYKIIGNNANNFIIKYSDKEKQLDLNTASEINKAFKEFDSIKQQIKINGDLSLLTDEDKLIRVNACLNKIAYTISSFTGYNPNSVKETLMKEIQ